MCAANKEEEVECVLLSEDHFSTGRMGFGLPSVCVDELVFETTNERINLHKDHFFSTL